MSLDRIADIDPRRWAIVGGKLYLNNGYLAQDLWSLNKSGNIASADSKLAAVSEESHGQVTVNGQHKPNASGRCREPTGRASTRPENCSGKCQHLFLQLRFWHDSRKLKVLGMGTALPGPPVSTAELLARVEKRFGVAVSRRGSRLASRLKIATRHICRDFEARRGGAAPRDTLIPIWRPLRCARHWTKRELEVGDLDLSYRPYDQSRLPGAARTSHSSPTVSALPAHTWNCVKPAPVLQTRW